MRLHPHSAAMAAVIALLAGTASAAPPVAAVKPVTDSYFGKSVTDPYRYMEDLASPEVQQWAKGQADETRSVLDAIPARAKLLARIAELDNSVPVRISGVRRLPGELYVFERRLPSDDQFKLCVRRGIGGSDSVLVDPDALTQASGTPNAITFFEPSPSGRYVAYGLSQGGSEEASIHVLEVATKKEVIAPIDRAHYSEAHWTPDDRGFFYFRQRALPAGTPETEKYKYQTAYFHALAGHGPDRAIIEAGRSTAIEIRAEEFPEVRPVLGTRWATAVPTNGVQREFSLYLAPLAEAESAATKWRKLFDARDDITDFAIHGDDLYLLSHRDAPRFKVLRTSVTRPDLASAEVVVAAGREVVVGLAAAKDALYVVARDGVDSKLYRVAYGKGGTAQPVALPFPGSLEIASVDPRLPGLLVSMGSWTRDASLFAWDAKAAAFVDTKLQPAGRFGTPDNLVAKEVTVRSWDGVQVPLSIVMPKGAKLDGTNPTMLYGYGSYGITDDPVYIPRFLAWYELGGVRATCHVRGGGAYGEEWHLAGKLDTKPNTWKDFVACAEYLIQEGYTTSARLGINGGSAGGILVGRAMTERPDLFAVAAPEVGDLNALRAEQSANGVPNIPEFGTTTDPKQFPALLEMDALAHVKDGTRYPATIVMTGINDPRVPPWESFKFAARLQAANASGKPVLLRIDYASGHGIGSTKQQREEEYADLWAFMLWQFGDPRFQPAK